MAPRWLGGLAMMDEHSKHIMATLWRKALSGKLPSLVILLVVGIHFSSSTSSFEADLDNSCSTRNRQKWRIKMHVYNSYFEIICMGSYLLQIVNVFTDYFLQQTSLVWLHAA